MNKNDTNEHLQMMQRPRNGKISMHNTMTEIYRAKETQKTLITGQLIEKNKDNSDNYTKTWYGRVIRKPDRLTYSSNATCYTTGQLVINWQEQLNHQKNCSYLMILGHLAYSVS